MGKNNNTSDPGDSSNSIRSTRKAQKGGRVASRQYLLNGEEGEGKVKGKGSTKMETKVSMNMKEFEFKKEYAKSIWDQTIF